MMKDNKPQEFKIPPQGSLGILALGAVGLRAWRKVRDEHRANLKKVKNNKEENGKKSS